MADNMFLRYREPTSEYEIGTDLIIGCSSLAGLYLSSTDEIAEETVISALNAGFYKFDTAPHYGCGLGEERLGRAINKISLIDRTDRLKIWTKVGRLMIPFDGKDSSLEAIAVHRNVDFGNVPGSRNCLFPDAPTNVMPVFDYTGSGVLMSHADSLKRLGVKTIHGLRVHDCESLSSINETLAELRESSTSTSGGLAALVKLRSDGIISEVSLGLNDADVALSILRRAPVGSLDSIMIAGCWNLLEHSPSSLELLLECQRTSVAVHNAGVFASGLLVGGSTYRYQQASADEIRRTQLWADLCGEYSVPLPAVALKFALLFTVIEAAAVGVKDPSEVLQLVEWFKCDVPPKLFHDARERGLVSRHVPLYGTP